MAIEVVGVRIEYTNAGRPFAEVIWTVKRQWDVPSYGPMGTLIQTNWQLFLPIGWRAPKGMLDGMRPLFSHVLNSFRYNPDWLKLRDQVQQQLNQQAKANLQQGYANIAAATAMSHQISAHNDAMLAGMQAHRAETNAAWQHQRQVDQAAANARSPTDGFDEAIRGVNTYEDPYWGQSQHSNEHDYAWTDGAGNYKYSNDPSFDPNIGATQNWQQMKRIGQN